MPCTRFYGIECSAILPRRVSYFRYDGIHFKLIQNYSPAYCDTLVTLDPNQIDQPDDHIFTAASEWLYCFCFDNKLIGRCSPQGAIGGSQGSIKKLKSQYGTFRTIHMHGHFSLDHDIHRISRVTTAEQKRALRLFMEAKASNSPFHRFLFFYQVLDIGGRAEDNVMAITNPIPPQIGFIKDDFKRIITALPLAEYLWEECRSAIAHFRRHPGKRQIDLNTMDDTERITISARIMEDIASYYLRKSLGLSDRLFLCRHGNKPAEYVHDRDPRIRAMRGIYIPAPLQKHENSSKIRKLMATWH